MPPIKISGPEPALIPEGRYECVCRGYALTDFMGGGKLYFYFEVCKGPHAGVQLEAYFNVKLVRVVGGANTFEAPPRSKYLRQMRRLFGDLEKRGEDFLSPDNLDGIKVLADVETVPTDSKRRPLGPEDQYSKIDFIHSLREV